MVGRGPARVITHPPIPRPSPCPRPVVSAPHPGHRLPQSSYPRRTNNSLGHARRRPPCSTASMMHKPWIFPGKQPRQNMRDTTTRSRRSQQLPVTSDCRPLRPNMTSSAPHHQRSLLHRFHRFVKAFTSASQVPTLTSTRQATAALFYDKGSSPPAPRSPRGIPSDGMD